MTLLAHLTKDARLLVRNRALLVALLLYPFLLAAVLGAAFQAPPARLSLVVVNDDSPQDTLRVGNETLSSHDIIVAATDYADVRVVPSEAAGLAAVRGGSADALLVIPRGFIGDLARLGGNATLRVVVDESDPVRASVARNAVQGGVDAFMRQIVARKVADVETLLDLTVHGGTTRVAFVDVSVLGIERARANLTEVLSTLDANSAAAQKVRDVITFLDFATGVLGNSNTVLTTTALPVDTQFHGLAARDTRLLAVALPGALVLTVFWTGALAGALLVARERETGAARRLAAAPGRGVAVLISKALVALVAALVPALVLLVLATAALGALVQDAALTTLALVLAALAAAALGILAAGLARRGSASGAALLVVLALMPMLLLGGLFYPVAYMPQAAQVVARALPVTLATDALRGAMLRGSDAAELLVPLGGLALFALVAGAAGVALTRRSRG